MNTLHFIDVAQHVGRHADVVASVTDRYTSELQAAVAGAVEQMPRIDGEQVVAGLITFALSAMVLALNSVKRRPHEAIDTMDSKTMLTNGVQLVPWE